MFPFLFPFPIPLPSSFFSRYQPISKNKLAAKFDDFTTISAIQHQWKRKKRRYVEKPFSGPCFPSKDSMPILILKRRRFQIPIFFFPRSLHSLTANTPTSPPQPPAPSQPHPPSYPPSPPPSSSPSATSPPHKPPHPPPCPSPCYESTTIRIGNLGMRTRRHGARGREIGIQLDVWVGGGRGGGGVGGWRL